VAGLPVIDAVSAVLDCAGAHDEVVAIHHELTGMLVGGHALRKVTPEQVRARVEAVGAFRGRGRLEAALRDVEGELSHSDAERSARHIARRVLGRRGHALHPRPFPVLLDERVVGEADLACVPLRLDIEVDGPHHRLPGQQERDRRRDSLVRQASWTVERFPTEMIERNPRRFEQRVSEAVAVAVAERSARM